LLKLRLRKRESSAPSQPRKPIKALSHFGKEEVDGIFMNFLFEGWREKIDEAIAGNVEGSKGCWQGQILMSWFLGVGRQFWES
jgi:hypothetical protein